MGAGMCIVEGLAVSATSPHQTPIAFSFPSYDNQKCLQTLSNVVNHNFSPDAQESPFVSRYLMESQRHVAFFQSYFSNKI